MNVYRISRVPLMAQALSPLDGPDGFAATETPAQRERAALDNQLIRAVSTKQFGRAHTIDDIQFTSVQYLFHQHAGAAMVLCDSGTLNRLILEAADEVAEGATSLEAFAKTAIDTFLQRLWTAGEQQ